MGTRRVADVARRGRSRWFGHLEHNIRVRIGFEFCRNTYRWLGRNVVAAAAGIIPGENV